MAQTHYEIGDLLAGQKRLPAQIAAMAVTRRLIPEGDNAQPEEAIRRMDIDDLCEIAMTVIVGDYINRSVGSSEHGRYWRYTLACATASGELAPVGAVNRALAYSGGLLHDIGRLALIAAYPEKYANMLALTDRMFASGEPVDLLEYERMLFGIDRFGVADWLATAWNLPPSLRPVVGKMERSPPKLDWELAAIVRTGSQLAHALGFSFLTSAPRQPVKAIVDTLPRGFLRGPGDVDRLGAIIEQRVRSYSAPPAV
jgi:hypothetical protein